MPSPSRSPVAIPVIPLSGVLKGPYYGLAGGDIDADGSPGMLLMSYEKPRGANSFRYRVGPAPSGP